jgi:hypothetical protein
MRRITKEIEMNIQPVGRGKTQIGSNWKQAAENWSGGGPGFDNAPGVENAGNPDLLESLHGKPSTTSETPFESKKVRYLLDQSLAKLSAQADGPEAAKIKNIANYMRRLLKTGAMDKLVPLMEQLRQSKGGNRFSQVLSEVDRHFQSVQGGGQPSQPATPASQPSFDKAQWQQNNTKEQWYNR